MTPGKRAFDLCVGAVFALVAVPVIVVAAIGCAISLRTWPFFTQDRIGRYGEPFRFVKLRTLPRSAPQYADKYVVNEFRIPWFTRTLRRLHIDELPQLFLVVIGRMSLVGPRPEMPDLHARLESTFARERTSVPPGCTGLWQVSTAYDRLIGESPQFDRFYVRNRSLRLDAWLLLRTVRKLLPGRGLVALDDVPAWTISTPLRDTGGEVRGTGEATAFSRSTVEVS